MRVVTCLLLVVVSALSRAQVLKVRGEAAACPTTSLLGPGVCVWLPVESPRARYPVQCPEGV